MKHDPTARPTIRVLVRLSDHGLGAFQARAVKESRWEDIQPLSSLAHPILEKSRSELGSSEQTFGRLIESSGDLRLAEVRHSQWRCGVWTDDDGVRWVVAAGLAKGGHQDYGDFYESLERICRTAKGRHSLLPTEADRRLLKRETAARLLMRWEFEIQSLLAPALREAATEGKARVTILHPSKGTAFATAEIEVAVVDEVEEILLEFIDVDRSKARLFEVLERRLLSAIAPPEQDWDKAYEVYSAMEQPGHCLRQAAALEAATARGELVESVPGQVAHRTHRRNIGDATVDGMAVRALCGSFFVPRTDPEDLPLCEECQQRYKRLPVG